MSSGDDGCLCVEGEGRGRDSYTTASSFIQKFLQVGSLPKGSLQSAEPVGQLYCQQENLSFPPTTPICRCSQEQFFVNENIGTKKSSSQLKLVKLAESVGQSHHLLYACSHGLLNAVQLVVTSDSDLDLNAPIACSNTNEQGFTPLAVASLSNTPQLCGHLIKSGAGVNSTDALLRSALHWAVLGNCLSSVKILLKNGASGEMVDKLGFTPLMYACVQRAPDIASAILKESQVSSGADKPHGECATTPIMIACLYSSSDIVKLLLKHGVQLSSSDNQGASSIHYAVWGGDIRCVKLVVSRGGRTVLSQRDQWGRTPLLIAAAKGNVNMCQFLLKKGAWLAEVDQAGRTVLHWAVLSRQCSCLQFLLSYSTSAGGGQALIHQTDNEGATPVHYATISTDIDILTTLIEKGASRCSVQTDHSGLSPLVWAAVCGNVPAVEMIMGLNDGGTSTGGEKQEGEETQLNVDKGSSPASEQEEDKRERQLSIDEGGIPANGEEEIRYENREKVQTDVNDGGTPNCVEQEEKQKGDGDEVKDTKRDIQQDLVFQPLQAGACVGSEEVCLVLLNSKAKVNSHSPIGLSPLHYASKFGHTACAKLLLEHGAMVDSVTPQHETGLHLACRYGHAGVTEELLQHHAKIDCPLPPLGDCPVHLAASGGHDNVLKVLIKHECNLDEERNTDHQTALHLAASGGHLGSCKVLVNQGCNTRACLPTVERLTALDFALLNGHTGVADFLIYCHTPSGGGAYHRAACTIQAVWRLYRHKCRMAAARQWCAAMIQRAVRHWLAERRAERLRLARERARHKAAATIQLHWKSYIAQKRRYESTYAKLKARLERERVAAELIMTELQYQRHSVELPTTAPIKVKSFTQPMQSSPTNPRYLLKATANPVSIFPSGSVVFPAKPHRPLIKRIPAIRVATKPNSSRQPSLTASPNEETGRDTTTTIVQNSGSSRERLCLPPVMLNTSLTASLKEINDRSCPIEHTASGRNVEMDCRPRPPSSDTVKLPAIPLRHASNLVASQEKGVGEVEEKLRSSPSHESVLKPAGGVRNRNSIKNSSSVDVISSSRHETKKPAPSSSPVRLQSQMRVTRYSTFKDTPLGYKPVSVTTKHPRRDSAVEENVIPGDIDLQDDRNLTTNIPETSRPTIVIKEQLSRDSPTTAHEQNSSGSVERLNTTEEPHSIASRSPHPPSIDGHLHQQAQRYDKLNQVLVLLQQAKENNSLSGDGSVKNIHSEPGTPPVKISELKAHIKTALDEAVRLRADTEALQHRVINKESRSHEAGTVSS